MRRDLSFSERVTSLTEHFMVMDVNAIGQYSLRTRFSFGTEMIVIFYRIGTGRG